jgi:sigma-B regulation protein RsbU (phosphoserine phosphatase)
MSTQNGTTGGPRVLVVDDALDVRLYLEELLKKWGYRVETAADGLEALERLEKEPISLVISDWMMPRMSGVDLCRSIRSADLAHYVYFILLTGRNTDNDLLEGMEAGADDFLTKPFSADELHARIKAARRVLHLEETLEQRNRALSRANLELRKNQETLRRDLDAAAVMQRSMLPAPQQGQVLNLQSLFSPAAMVAGDLYNYMHLDDRHLAFYHIDVAGHGVRSAMLSFTLGMMLSGTSSEGSPVKQLDPDNPGVEQITTPSAVVLELNRRFQDNSDTLPYFTMIYGVIDTTTGRVRMCTAGHPAPLLIRGNGSVEQLGQGSFPVGLIADADYDEIEFDLDAEDRLFCYSDGISECMNTEEQPFGTDRLIDQLRNTRRRPLPESLSELQRRLATWRGGHALDDDVSLLAIEFRPTPVKRIDRLDPLEQSIPGNGQPFNNLPESSRTTP